MVTQMVRYAGLRLLVVPVVVTLVPLFPPLVSQRLHGLSRARRLCFLIAHRVLRPTDRSPPVTTALQLTTASRQRSRYGSDKGALFR